LWRFEEISLALQRTIDINGWNNNLTLINKKLDQYRERDFTNYIHFGFLKKEKVVSIDGSKFRIKDVYDAAMLTNFVLNYHNLGLMINYPKLLFQKIKYKTRKLLKKINKLF
jgi:hypothetical protein